MMSPVTSVARVFEAIQTAKAGGGAFCTNFFPTQAKLAGWIDHGELVGMSYDQLALFARKDRDFWHFYFCAANLEALRTELNRLPNLRTERVVVDLVGSEASLEPLISSFGPVGFRPYARLIRLTRGGEKIEGGRKKMEGVAAEVVVARQEDRNAVLDLLETSFDRYADQLPMPYEIDAAIAAKQILAVRRENALAALLHFETQGFTSTVRYWVAAEPFRSQRLGAVLIRHYFATQSHVRRFILWVTADNENALTKYQHYGYSPDGLVDHVLVNDLIRA